MAQRIIHQPVDDIDGQVLEPGERETGPLSIEGRSYKIDLSDKNAQVLREAFAPFIAAG